MDTLEFDKELIERLGISEEYDIATDDKQDFLDMQIAELKKMLFRMRVDLNLANNLINSSNEDSKQKGYQQKKELEAGVPNVISSIDTMVKLREAL